MTISPDPGQSPEPTPPRRSQRRLWRRVGLGLGLMAVIGGVAGARWLWHFIQVDLVPLIETELSKTLDRPINLGDLERFTLTGARLGESTIPETVDDRDHATIEAVKVRFNPIQALLSRKLALDVTLIKPNVFLDQTTDGVWVNLPPGREGQESNFKIEPITIRLEDGTLEMVPSPRTERDQDYREVPEAIAGTEAVQPPPAAVPSIVMQNVNGVTTLAEGNRVITFDVQADPANDGALRIGGEARLDDDQTKLAIQGENLLASEIDALVPLPLNFEAGRLWGNLKIQLDDSRLASVRGSCRFQDVTATIPGVPNALRQADGRLRFQDRTIRIEGARALYGDIPAQASGLINLDRGYDLRAQARGVAITNVLNTFELNTPVAIRGAANAALRITGELDQPLLQGNASNAGPVRIDRVDVASFRTVFSLTPRALSFDSIEATPVAGGRVAGSGLVTFGKDDGPEGRLTFDLRGTNLPGDAIARPYGLNQPNVRLGRIGAEVNIYGGFQNFQTNIAWRAPEATYSGQGEIQIAGDRIRIQNTALQVAGGMVQARGESVRGRWQGVVDAAGVRLNQFSQTLSGALGGTVRLSGTLNNLTPEGIRAEGDLRFSEGIAALNRPLTTSVQWLGDRLEVQQATAPGFSANGILVPRLRGAGAPTLDRLDLTVALQDFNLAELPVALPSQVQATGAADFAGRVQGSLAALTVAGTLGFDRLVVNNVAFDSRLSGPLRYAAGRGLAVDLRGNNQDQITVALDGRNRPQSFLVRRDETMARGQGLGDRLLASVENLPLQWLNLRPAAEQGLGVVSGVLNGNFDLNLANLSSPVVLGSVAIARPAIGYITADTFSTQFRYANGAATLTDGDLTIGESRILLAGSYNQATADLRAQVTVERGTVQDVLTALQWFELPDLSRGIQSPTYDQAGAIAVVPIDVTGLSLLDKLRRYSEVVALQDQIAQQNYSPIPALQEFQGTFAGNINLANTRQTGLTLDFDLLGQEWSWGPEYRAAEVVAQGSLEDGVLSLLPLRFQTDDQLIAFSGQVGGAQQSGLLQVQNIPVEPLQTLVSLPVDLEGNLNATAILSGSVQNPELVGEINLTDGSINDTPLQQARSSFGYDDARLSLNGRLILNEPEPLILVGSVPYALPFMDTDPTTPGINLLPEIPPQEEIDLDINVRNEGLVLLNVLSRGQVKWEGGEGDLDVRISGTLQKPQALGTARFNDASISAAILPEPLTGVTGQVLFNRDRIQVETLAGQFTTGDVSAVGELPIFDPRIASAPDFTQPLTLTLNRIGLDYSSPVGQRLYDGNVDGQVLIMGAALAPIIGGEVALSNGLIFLPDGTQPIVSDAGGTVEEDSILTPPRLDDFVIELNEGLLVTSSLVRIIPRGVLEVDGTFDNLQPSGEVTLMSGQINLFTTFFNLERDYDNRVIFSPENGLNPYLDISLLTTVPEVTGAPSLQTASPFVTSETLDQPISDFGTLQTIRIQARVDGTADTIFSNLELSSSPRRTRNEIIGLLGGGFVDTLGRGDVTLAIANLAGSALLTRVQNFIANAIGLSQFRLFPTSVSSGSDNTSSLGIAAEVGFDITRNFSVSALQILTDEQVPTQFNLRYRINEEFQIRANTDLQDASRIILEFETRF